MYGQPAHPSGSIDSFYLWQSVFGPCNVPSMIKRAEKKLSSTKIFFEDEVIDVNGYEIFPGQLVTRRKIKSLAGIFTAFGEKLPKDALSAVFKHARSRGLPMQGVYVAHDSMGTPRYIGRGNIESRLRARFKAQPLELHFFSFYVVPNKFHEREIETLLIHVVGSLLDFNEKKRRIGLRSHAVGDFEAGTQFYQWR